MAPKKNAETSEKSTPFEATSTKYTIVKCPLKKVMNLKEADWVRFKTVVEEYCFYISRMLRFASIQLHYEVTRCLENGEALPDLYNQKDTYFKNLIKGGYRYINDDESIYCDCKLQVINDRVSLNISYTNVSDEYIGLVNSPSGPSLDQIVGYAAIAFRTLVHNNAYLPLFQRTLRLLKTIVKNVKKRFGKKEAALVPSAYQIIQNIRSNKGIDETYSLYPEIKSIAIEIRQRLLYEEGKYLADDHGYECMTFQQVMSYNYWLQKAFESNNLRKMQLMPIYSVSRKHVRLDTRTLRSIFKMLFPDNEYVKELKNMDSLEQSEKKNGVGRGFDNPNIFMFPEKPSDFAKKKNKCTDEEWKRITIEKEQYNATIRNIKDSKEYKQQLDKYNSYLNLENIMITSMFKPLPKKKDQVFDCSIVTDGVSVSLQFSKKVTKMVNSAKKQKEELKVVEQYDKTLDMYDSTTGVLTVGLDPGRVRLAVLGFITHYSYDSKTEKFIKTSKPKKFSTSLSKAQYRLDSGIKRVDFNKKKRLERFVHSFTKLGTKCGLRTTKSSDISMYFRQQHKIVKDWWDLELQHIESKDKLERYIGKRRVLDTFFSNTIKAIRKMFDFKVEVKVVYGSAGITMKSSGKGEVSAPTTETYLACKRIHKNTEIGSERNSTKTRWETGKDKLKVYKTSDGTVHPYASFYTPKVPEEEKEKTIIWMYNDYVKKEKRKGKTNIITLDEFINKCGKKLRYPEVRGLRFCTESCKFHDRDIEAATAIGRLKILHDKGMIPLCFTSQPNRQAAENV